MDESQAFWIRIALMALLAMFLPHAFVGHAEAHWIAKYKGKSGYSCCGISDCWKATTRIVKYNGDHVDIEVNGEIIKDFPMKAVHVSETGDGWVCFPLGDMGMGYDMMDFMGSEQSADTTIGENGCTKGDTRDECIECFFYVIGS